MLSLNVFKSWHSDVNVRLSYRLIQVRRFYGCCHPLCQNFRTKKGIAIKITPSGIIAVKNNMKFRITYWFLFITKYKYTGSNIVICYFPCGCKIPIILLWYLYLALKQSMAGMARRWLVPATVNTICSCLSFYVHWSRCCWCI